MVAALVSKIIGLIYKKSSVSYFWEMKALAVSALPRMFI